MPATISVRDLRNRFPHVRKLVEAEGEVLLSESGKTRYRLVLHAEGPAKTAPPAKDYMARLKKFQPRPISKAAAKAIHAENRGER
jgi:hypothetical protein